MQDAESHLHIYVPKMNHENGFQVIVAMKDVVDGAFTNILMSAPGSPHASFCNFKGTNSNLLSFSTDEGGRHVSVHLPGPLYKHGPRLHPVGASPAVARRAVARAAHETAARPQMHRYAVHGT